MQTALALPKSEPISSAESRVLKQLLEALLFEGQLEFSQHATSNGDRMRFNLTIQGQNYTLYGKQAGFDRIRVEKNTLIASGLSLGLLLTACDSNPDAIQRLQQELQQTITLSDWNAMHLHRATTRRHLSSQQLEQLLDEGHLYHPCFKARTGFSIADHRLYGPEAGHSFQLHWLAVDRQIVKMNLPCGESQFWIKEIGQTSWALLNERLRLLDGNWHDYALLPIHPWQWLTLKADMLNNWLQDGTVLYLAAAGDSYQATQSVRSLMNVSNPVKAHIKLPLNMVNTSALRTLEPHSVCSAPVISHWLKQIVDNDPYLSQQQPLVILEEYAGILVEPEQNDLAGQLAVIWRDSIDKHAQPHETAIPFNALLLTEQDGKPFIHDWIQEYSLQVWLKQLFDTSVLPVWHLLVEHGVAIEAHAQNLILLHQDGWPQRLAARDFHESVEFVEDFLAQPELKPDFLSLDSCYADDSPDTFYWMQNVDALRELFVDTMYIYNLSELAHLLSEHYRFNERQFWRLLQTSLEQYAETHPRNVTRAARIGMQQKQFRTESLITRKLRYPQTAECHHVVKNPFYSV
ncbi:IucA/IucC family protein [Methylophaga thiooxydans]|uniref:IucA/IucC family protein n=1 Tax=Methylophaga thiooxydans TaxID=392484 RepID=UPI0003174187|nr:IucA/IucC family protein [Methylophaga thiooxydans]